MVEGATQVRATAPPEDRKEGGQERLGRKL
jgi:hypothetical protein